MEGKKEKISINPCKKLIKQHSNQISVQNNPIGSRMEHVVNLVNVMLYDNKMIVTDNLKYDLFY